MRKGLETLRNHHNASRRMPVSPKRRWRTKTRRSGGGSVTTTWLASAPAPLGGNGDGNAACNSSRGGGVLFPRSGGACRYPAHKAVNGALHRSWISCCADANRICTSKRPSDHLIRTGTGCNPWLWLRHDLRPASFLLSARAEPLGQAPLHQHRLLKPHAGPTPASQRGFANLRMLADCLLTSMQYMLRSTHQPSDTTQMPKHCHSHARVLR